MVVSLSDTCLSRSLEESKFGATVKVKVKIKEKGNRQNILPGVTVKISEVQLRK